MNKQQIIEYIEHPELLGEGNFADLKLLSEKYPYAGLLQTLYAKALHNENSIFFEEQLKKTAVTNANRKKLYQTIHQPRLQKVIKKIDEDINLIAKEKKQESTGEKDLNKKEDTIEKHQVKKINELDELEKNVLSEAINSSLLSDVSDEIPSIEDLTKNKIEKKIEPSTTKQIEKSSFSSWFSNEASPISKRKDISNLVDGFLSKNKTEDKKKEFFSPTNLAKMSLVDNEDFVTETLAKIYSSQGNFDKAIRIYEQLILNYPEKKTFFASQIRILKDKKE